MRTLFSFLWKRMGAPLVVALIAAFAAIFIGPTPQAQAEANDHGAGGYGGQLIKQTFEKSSATPIGGGSTANPLGSLPGRVTLYTSGTGSWKGLVRVRIARKDQPVVVNNYQVQVDSGEPLNFDLRWWDAAYTVVLFEDTNGNGVIDAGDRRVRTMRASTRRGWARRHAWLTRQWDIVTAANTDGGTNPSPTTTYPLGAIVTRNGRVGATITRIDYNVGVTAFAFAYGNVPKDSWAYERLATFDGQQVTVKVTWNDGRTQTKIIMAPASGSAAAVVTTFDTPDA